MTIQSYALKSKTLERHNRFLLLALCCLALSGCNTTNPIDFIMGMWKKTTDTVSDLGKLEEEIK